MRDALWTVCAWLGAVSLGCCAVVALWLGYVMLLDRWRAWRPPTCRMCLAPISSGERRFGHHVCPCRLAWLLRDLRIPREVMG